MKTREVIVGDDMRARIVPGGMIISNYSFDKVSVCFVPCSFNEAEDWISANNTAKKD